MNETVMKELVSLFEAAGFSCERAEADQKNAERFQTITARIPEMDQVTPPQQYMQQLLRYLFMKGMECCVASALYGNSGRELAADTYIGTDEIFDSAYRTNLPLHIHKAVMKKLAEAEPFLVSVFESMQAKSFPAEETADTLLGVMLLGFDLAVSSRVAETRLQNYQNQNMLTPDEVRQLGLKTLMGQMKQSGYEIKACNPKSSAAIHLIASYEDEAMCIVADVRVYPEKPQLSARELDTAYDIAKSRGAVPGFTYISVGSTNTKHFNAGVIMTTDQVKVRVEAFDQLITQEEKEMFSD